METDSNYEEMIALIGNNKSKNDWNHKDPGMGVNAWIGKLADGSVATVQAGEWTKTPWACGTGKKGSCNGTKIIDGVRSYVGQHWIQFEICADDYTNKEYFDKIYKEAVELTAMLCKEFDIDPFGVVEWNGVVVPTIICHADSYKYELGSNHGDVYKWFGKMGLAKNMDKVKTDVAALLKPEKAPDNSYQIVTTVNMYGSSGDARRQENPVGKFSAGTYYMLGAYPTGYKGVYCLCKDKAGTNAIGWMNPVENILPKEEVKVEEPPIAAAPTPAPEPEVVEPQPTPETEDNIGNMIFELIKHFFSWLINLFKNSNKGD
jgi:hypothetical protein